MPVHYSNFHDGLVRGVRLDDGAATLFLRQVDGTDYEILLSGMTAFQIDEFRECNVISRVMLFREERPDVESAFKRLFWPPHASAPAASQERHRSHVEEKKKMVERGEAVLFLLVPSFGADIVAFCRSVEFCRIGE